MFQRGQAFDVFKLLIAAVVAIAILAVLLPLIPNPDLGTDPNSTAAKEVSNAAPSAHRLSEEVTFNKSDSLNAKAIATGSNRYSNDQVCVSAGEFFGDPNFAERGNGVVEYLGSGSKKAKLSVLCDTGTALAQDFSTYQLDASWLDSCGCTADAATCCIIALRKT